MTDMEKIYEDHRKLHEKFRSVGRKGKLVEFRGNKYKVYPSVFWPMADSEPLLDNYKINPEEKVLDVGTGTGVIAIDAALKGASYVLAVDINPNAVKAAQENVRRFGVEDKVEVKQRFMLENLGREKFDVITGNLPFYKHKTDQSKDYAEVTTWNESLLLYSILFGVTAKYDLKPEGRIYLAQSTLGPLNDVMQIASREGWIGKQIGEKSITEPLKRTFLAFEFNKQR